MPSFFWKKEKDFPFYWAGFSRSGDPFLSGTHGSQARKNGASSFSFEQGGAEMCRKRHATGAFLL